MASGAAVIRDRFQACLSGQNCFSECKNPFTSCLSGIASYLEDPTYPKYFINHVGRFIKGDGIGQILKLLDPFLDAAVEINKATGGSDETLKALHVTRDFVKGGRDLFSFFKIFDGIITNLVAYLKNVYLLARSLFTRDEEPVYLQTEREKTRERQLRGSIRFGEGQWGPIAPNTFHQQQNPHNARAVGLAEKFLKLGSDICSSISTTASVIGFGVCRPIAITDKYIRKDGKPLIEMGETTLALGKAFPIVMFINHVAGLIGAAFESAFQFLAYDHVAADFDGHTSKTAADDFFNKILDVILGVFEKFLELIMDIVYLIGETAPPYLRIPVSLGLGLLGFYREWGKTA